MVIYTKKQERKWQNCISRLIRRNISLLIYKNRAVQSLPIQVNLYMGACMFDNPVVSYILEAVRRRMEQEQQDK